MAPNALPSQHLLPYTRTIPYRRPKTHEYLSATHSSYIIIIIETVVARECGRACLLFIPIESCVCELWATQSAFALCFWKGHRNARTNGHPIKHAAFEVPLHRAWFVRGAAIDWLNPECGNWYSTRVFYASSASREGGVGRNLREAEFNERGAGDWVVINMHWWTATSNPTSAMACLLQTRCRLFHLWADNNVSKGDCISTRKSNGLEPKNSIKLKLDNFIVLTQFYWESIFGLLTECEQHFRYTAAPTRHSFTESKNMLLRILNL